MRLAQLFLVFLLTRAAFADSSQLPYLYVDHELNRVGMFSVISYVAGVLNHYEKHDYAGLEVTFGENSPYYDPACGPNWWEYYCEPIRLGNQGDAYVKKTNTRYGRYASIAEKQLSRERVHELIEKYIKIKEPILEKVDQFALENFSGYHIIGIHYRGTDKISEAPRVSYEEVLSRVQKYLAKTNPENFKIFVASDEFEFIEFMHDAFPDLVITYSTLHSENGVPLHYGTTDPYLQGEEALIDCLLLSRGDLLIRTSSNLSRWSTFFNPTIPVVELNERYSKYDTKKKKKPTVIVSKKKKRSLSVD